MATTIIADQQTQVSQLYVSLFGRAADNAGFGYWVSQLASGVSLQNIAQSFYNSTEARTLYSAAQTNQQFVIQFYSSVLGRTVTGTDAGVAYWTAQLNVAGKTQGSLIIDILTALSAPSTDPVVIASQNLLNARTSVSTAYALANGQVGGASAILSNVVDAGTAATAIAAIGNGTIGSTFTLTSNIDSLVGTSGNDLFVGDTSITNSISAADSISGGTGNDTLKIFANGTSITGIALPQLSSVENLIFTNGAATAAATLDVSGIVGLTSVTIDTPSAALAGASTFTVKETAAQTLSLTKVNAAAAGTGTIAINGAALVNLNAVGTDATATGTVSLDVIPATATTFTINATGAASKVALANTGAALATLNITGDKAVTISEGLSTLKTVNASTDTGGVTLTTTAAVNAAFAFTGGAGNDTLNLTTAGLTALTAGTQLDGGAGTDTLGLGNATFVAADYAKINAVKNFELLALGGATVDAAQITAFKEIQFGSGTNVVTNSATTNVFDITGSNTSVSIAGGVGINTATVNVGTATTAGLTGETLILNAGAINNVTLNSLGTNAAANVLALTNVPATLLTIAGSNDLTVTLTTVSAGQAGSSVTATAFTGKLNITSSGGADTLVGGSGADTFNIHAATTAALGVTVTVTGGAGADNFDAHLNLVGVGGTSASYNSTLIKDATAGDKITLVSSTNTTLTAVAAGPTTLAGFLDAAAAGDGSAQGIFKYFTFGGDTYIVEDRTATATLDATDIVIKLTGTVDLTSAHATIASGVITLA